MFKIGQNKRRAYLGSVVAMSNLYYIIDLLEKIVVC
jgi:hypothetical protein